ncbi:MAG: F0F1 ATP synthase subunit B [Planctomycetales bacterium]|nr:F0F1 ATP synthase subunit B [Planctomycetales bacterium]
MSYLRFALMAVAVLFVSLGPAGVTGSAFAADDPKVAADADHEGGEEESADGEHAEHVLPPILSMDPGAAIVNVVIFLGTFLILAKLVWPVILGGLKAREDKIASDLKNAQDANLKAEQLLADYEKKVQDVASEAQGILAEARRDAQSNATKIIDEAKADARRQGERALADIETAKKVALSEIASQTSALAIGVAKQVVGRELKAEDHAELIRKSLEQVPSKN